VRTPMIVPTGRYRSFPALSPDQAANLVADALAHRPRRVASPLGNFVELAHAVLPGAVENVANGAYRLLR